MTIISAYQDTGTYRGAAAICGTTPKTVKRVIERAKAGGVRPAPKDRARNYEVVADLVAQRVKKSSGRITAKRLLPAARAGGYEGSARNFRRLVAQAKRDWRAEHHRGRRPAIWSPGEHLVIDWGSHNGVNLDVDTLWFWDGACWTADRGVGRGPVAGSDRCGGVEEGLRAEPGR